MTDKYQKLRGDLEAAITDAKRQGGVNERAEQIAALLAERDALAAAPVSADRETLMRGIVQAGQQAGIIRPDLEAVSVSECLHILDCLAKPCAPVSAEPVEIDLDRALSIADAHADESREDGCRVFDRGGILAFAQDVLRVAAPVAAQAQPHNMDDILTAVMDYGYQRAMFAKGKGSENEIKRTWEAFKAVLTASAALAQQPANIEAAAKTLAVCLLSSWGHMPEPDRDVLRQHASRIIDAARKEAGHGE